METQTHRGFATSADEGKKLDEAIDALGYQDKLATFGFTQDSEFDEKEEEEENKFHVNSILETKIPDLSKTKEAKLHLDLAHFTATNHLPFETCPILLEFCQYLSQNYDQQLLEMPY